LGAFALPNGSRDAVLLSTLNSGAYTAHVRGKTGVGVALAEVYDASTSETARLVAISARTRAGTGAEVLIVGFVVAGNTPKRLLIRGIGPTLANYDVAGVLADPQLALYKQGSLAPLQQNDNWGGDPALKAAFLDTGTSSLDDSSKDAALLVTLDPGVYSAVLTGKGNTTGIALVEVYEVP
jgi:hypothetical protein